MPTPDHNFEWLKILVSTIAGLFTGLIAEPIRNTLQRKIEIIRLEHAIGLDCLRALTAILSTRNGLVTSPASYWRMDPLPAYQQYWDSKRELFYVDFDLQFIQMKCMYIQIIRQNVLDGHTNADAALTDTENALREILGLREGKTNLRSRLRRLLLRFVT